MRQLNTQVMNQLHAWAKVPPPPKDVEALPLPSMAFDREAEPLTYNEPDKADGPLPLPKMRFDRAPGALVYNEPDKADGPLPLPKMRFVESKGSPKRRPARACGPVACGVEPLEIPRMRFDNE